jgi:hypothetical protein
MSSVRRMEYTLKEATVHSSILRAPVDTGSVGAISVPLTVAVSSFQN